MRDRVPPLDWPLLFSTLALVGIGLLTVYSATYLPGAHQGLWQKQMVWFGVAAACAWVVASIHYRFYDSFAWPLYGVSLLLLVAVFLVGVERMGAKRWLEFGAVGEDDTFATAPLETVKNKDGIEFELVKAIDGNTAPFSGPEDFIPCLNVNAGSSEMRMIKDAVVGGILAGLGQEEAMSSIFDAFFMAAKVDKCRSDIRKFASHQ